MEHVGCGLEIKLLMRLTRSRLVCVVFLLVAGICGAGAGEGDFKVGVRDEEIPEAGMVTYTTLTTSVNEFVFLPPPRWKPLGRCL